MKTDARVRYTKKLIRETFLGCMKDKSVREMTVKEICDKACINRATFYKYYRDCYDLMNQIGEDMLSDYKASLEDINIFDVSGLVDSVFDIIEKNSELCDLLIFQRKEDELLKKMISIAHDRCIGIWKKHLTRAGADEVEMLFCCLTNGLIQVIIGYYGTLSRKQITDFILKTVNNAFTPYL